MELLYNFFNLNKSGITTGYYIGYLNLIKNLIYELIRKNKLDKNNTEEIKDKVSEESKLKLISK